MDFDKIENAEEQKEMTELFDSESKNINKDNSLLPSKSKNIKQIQRLYIDGNVLF